jgi:hypothetical protein
MVWSWKQICYDKFMNFKGSTNNLFNARIEFFAKTFTKKFILFRIPILWKGLRFSKGLYSFSIFNEHIPFVSRCQSTILLKIEVIVPSAKRSMLRQLKWRLNLSDNMLLKRKNKVPLVHIFFLYFPGIIYNNLRYNFEIYLSQEIPASIWWTHGTNHLHVNKFHWKQFLVVIPCLKFIQISYK